MQFTTNIELTIRIAEQERRQREQYAEAQRRQQRIREEQQQRDHS